MKNLFQGTLFLLFLGFALLQLNDEGALPWVIAYGWVALLTAMNLFRVMSVPARLFQWTLLLSLGVYLIWALLWLPEVVTWVGLGMPSVTGSMRAETPYIEYVREFGGLLLCAAAVIWLYRDSHRNPRKMS